MVAKRRLLLLLPQLEVRAKPRVMSILKRFTPMKKVIF